MKNKELQKSILQNKDKLKPETGTQDQYINEDLSTWKNEVLFELRQLKKKYVIKSIWTYRGDIYVKRDDNDEPSVIKSKRRLELYKGWLTQTASNSSQDARNSSNHSVH